MWICTPQKKIMWVPTEDLIYKSDSDTVVGIYNFLPLLSSWCFVFVLFIAFSGECNLLDSISSQQKFEARDVKALGMSQFSDSLCYSSQTDQFYLENKETNILEAWGHANPKDAKRRERERERVSAPARGRERERPLAIWLLLLYVFSFHPGPALCKLG